MQSPLYGQVRILHKAPLGRNSFHAKMCYICYPTMVEAGGSWMSVSVYGAAGAPSCSALRQQGGMALHGWCDSKPSGPAALWAKQPDRSMISDMLVLQSLFERSEVTFKSVNIVADARDYVLTSTAVSADCTGVPFSSAMHFSHQSLLERFDGDRISILNKTMSHFWKCQ